MLGTLMQLCDIICNIICTGSWDMYTISKVLHAHFHPAFAAKMQVTHRGVHCDRSKQVMT